MLLLSELVILHTTNRHVIILTELSSTSKKVTGINVGNQCIISAT